MKKLLNFYNRQDFMTKAVLDGLLVFSVWLVLVAIWRYGFAIGNLSGI